MSQSLNDSKPLYLQIKDKIADQIITGQLKEHNQIPSTTQMVQFYKLNHITVSKGINILVDDGILYKKRGVGIFVAPGAKKKLSEQGKEIFADRYVLPMLREADKLGLSDGELLRILRKIKGDNFGES